MNSWFWLRYISRMRWESRKVSYTHLSKMSQIAYLFCLNFIFLIISNKLKEYIILVNIIFDILLPTFSMSKTSKTSKTSILRIQKQLDLIVIDRWNFIRKLNPWLYRGHAFSRFTLKKRTTMINQIDRWNLTRSILFWSLFTFPFQQYTGKPFEKLWNYEIMKSEKPFSFSNGLIPNLTLTHDIMLTRLIRFFLMKSCERMTMMNIRALMTSSLICDNLVECAKCFRSIKPDSQGGRHPRDEIPNSKFEIPARSVPHHSRQRETGCELHRLVEIKFHKYWLAQQNPEYVIFEDCFCLTSHRRQPSFDWCLARLETKQRAATASSWTRLLDSGWPSGDNSAKLPVGFALSERDSPIQRIAQFNESGGERTRSCRVRNGCRPARKRVQIQAFSNSCLSIEAICSLPEELPFFVWGNRPAIEEPSALRCIVRQSVSFAFTISISEHRTRQRRRHMIRAHDKTILLTSLPESMLCCRHLCNAFGFVSTRFDGSRKSKHWINKWKSSKTMHKIIRGRKVERASPSIESLRVKRGLT
jgi:hypothetical protein